MMGSHRAVRRATAGVAALLTLTVSLTFAEESTIKENAKEAGRAVGTGVREVAAGAKQVGTAVGEAAKEVVEAAKEGGKELKRAVKGDGNDSSNKPRSKP